LARGRVFDAELFAVGGFEGSDGEGGLVHCEVVAVEAVVPGGLLAVEGHVGIGGDRGRRGGEGDEGEECGEAERCGAAVRALNHFGGSCGWFGWTRLCRVGGPDLADRFFLAEALGRGGAGIVGVVPSLAVERRAERAAAGHLKMAGRIGLAHPIPAVAEPVVAVLFGLLGEPGDLVVAPDPDAADLGLAGFWADAPIVELDEVGEVVAGPAGEGGAALAAVVEAVGEADFQDGFAGLIGDFHDTEGERVEIEQELSVADEATARYVAVAQDRVAARVGGGVRADEGEDLRPVRQVAVVAVHDLDLAEMDRLDTDVDVRRGLAVEPELGLHPANVGDGPAAAPIAPLAGRVDHVGVTERALLDRLAERLERPRGHRHLLDLGRDDLEDAGLEDHVRVGGVEPGNRLPGALEVAREIVLASPQAQAPADELGAGVLEHSDVVVEVAVAVEEALHRDRAGEVVVQYFARRRAVETVVGAGGAARDEADRQEEADVEGEVFHGGAVRLHSVEREWKTGLGTARL